MVAVVGTQIQKHRTRLGGGAVEICAMSSQSVSALKLQPVLSSRATKKPTKKPKKKAARNRLN
jgi:hypothetical protein